MSKHSCATRHQRRRSLIQYCLCLLALLARLASPAQAQPGRIHSVSIETNGWQLLIKIEGMSSGGAYELGLDETNRIKSSSSPLRLKTWDSGFDDEGRAILLEQTRFATTPIRKAYPQQAAFDEVVDATGVTLRVALSDFVYRPPPPDSAQSIPTPTIDIPAGFYRRNGIANLEAQQFPVNNRSLEKPPRVVANWSWPGNNICDENVATLRAVAFHSSGRELRPVRLVHFWVTDGTRTNSNWARTTEISRTHGDAVPIEEFVGRVSLDGFNDGAPLSCHFAAFPWIGDTASVADTSRSADVFWPSTSPAPQRLFKDSSGGFSRPVAVVASTGNDATGAVVRRTSFNPQHPPPAFATISGAASAIAASNLIWNGVDNVDGGILLLRSGNHKWTGGAYPIGVAPSRTWFTITSFPGDLNATIDGATGNKAIPGHIKLAGIKLATASTSGVFSGFKSLWMDQCALGNISDAAFVRSVSEWVLTRSEVRSLPQGVAAYRSTPTWVGLVRGNTFVGLSGRQVSTYTVLGNLRLPDGIGGIAFSTPTDPVVPASTNVILAYNKILGNNSSGGAGVATFFRADAKSIDGAAFVQNLIENIRPSPSPAANSLAPSTTSNDETNIIDNVLVWHNTIVGERGSYGENASGTLPARRMHWSIMNNAWDDANTRHDIDGTPHGARTGGWPILYGVGSSGNVNAEMRGIGNGGAFRWRFLGLNSYQPPTGFGSSAGFFEYSDNRAYRGDLIPGLGNGDYHPSLTSILVGLPKISPLGFDQEGNRRSRANASGSVQPIFPPPAPPTHVATTILPDDSILVHWDANDTHVESWIVHRSINNQPPERIAELPAQTREHIDSAPRSIGSTVYLVQAANRSGSSTFTQSLPIEYNPVPFPTPPYSLELSVQGPNLVHLTWEYETQAPIDELLLQRSSEGEVFHTLAHLPPETRSFADATVQADSPYWFRLLAVNARGVSDPSPAAFAQTPPSPPIAPSDLVAFLGNAASEVILQWSDRSSNETEFRIERAIGTEDFLEWRVLAPNVTQTQDEDLLPGVSVRYRIQALNDGGASPFSTEASIFLPVSIPITPSALAADLSAPTQVHLTWIDSSSNELGFHIERSVNSSPFLNLATLPAESSEFFDVDVQPSWTVQYRVRAFNSGGDSEFSNVASVVVPVTFAPGDIVSAEVETNGWVLKLTLQGAMPGGVFSSGLGPNNATIGLGAAPTIRLNLASPGFDANAQPTFRTRQLFGTALLRKPYPNHAESDVQIVENRTVLRIALSDVVYRGDSNLQLEIASGFYNTGAIASRSAERPIVHDSKLDCPKVIANWSMPGFNEITSDTHPLRAVAFHRDGTGGHPIAAIDFYLTDGVRTNYTRVNALELSSLPDAVKVQEYRADVPTVGLSQGRVWAGFRAYPWVGETASILDTTDPSRAANGPLYGQQSAYLANQHPIPGAVALISPTGNDANGAVVARSLFNLNAPPTPFKTIARAASAIAAFNATFHGRNDTGLSIIYCLPGAYVWSGNTGTFGNIPDSWLQVEAFPGAQASDVIFSSVSGSKHIGKRTRFKGVTWQISSGSVHDSAAHLWFDQCLIHYSATSQFVGGAGASIWHLTHCQVTSLRQGCRPYSTQNAPCALVRGNRFINMNPNILAYTVLGNLRTGAGFTSSMLATEISNQSAPASDGWIIAFNKWMELDCSDGQPISLRKSTPQIHGGAFVQNLVEVARGGNSPALIYAGDAQTVPISHSIVGDNTLVGQRANLFYDDIGDVAHPRSLSRVYRNYWQDVNIKSDTFPGNPGGAHGARTGNWADLYRVGAFGNIDGEIQGIGSNNGFRPEFVGINSYRPPGKTTHPAGWEWFVRSEAYNGANGAGNGDYRLQDPSPLRNLLLPSDFMLPFDIEGHPRNNSSPPGVHADE